MIDIVEHLSLLKYLCYEANARKVLELGVRGGESTRALADTCKDLDAELISVDIEDCSLVTDFERWRFIQADDIELEFNEEIDLLFIDTSHTYEHTLAELRKYAPLVRKGGFIALHDTNMFPVMEAIEQYLRDNPIGCTFVNLSNCNGLGILEKKEQ